MELDLLIRWPWNGETNEDGLGGPDVINGLEEKEPKTEDEEMMEVEIGLWAWEGLDTP